MIAPGMHRFSMMERVVHGQPAASVVKDEAFRLDLRRVFLILRPASTAVMAAASPASPHMDRANA
jgi:hypothetical protein